MMFVGGIDHVYAFRQDALGPYVEGCVGVVDGGFVV